MSSKLIRKSLQQSINQKNHENDINEQTRLQLNTYPKKQNQQTKTEMTNEELLQAQVKTMVMFDKYSNRVKSSQARLKEKRMKSFEHTKRMRKKVLSKTTMNSGVIFNSRSSSSINNSKIFKAPKTVTKEGVKKEREKRAMEELVKRFKKHKSKKSR